MSRTVLSTIVMGVAATVMAMPAQADEVARRLVCPPQLTYCYYVAKPIRSGPTSEDTLRSITETVDCLKRDNDYNLAHMSEPSRDSGCARRILPR